MKKFLIAAALVTAAASPSFAATSHHRHVVTPQRAATDSYAMMPASNVVVQGGQVLGADPDPFIRGQMERLGDPANLNN
ncbi:hypothetical protein [Undibacter mobilis]|uniref:Uncharacterized protein n=1 Tax=Undibacter mobilis TaxID=2292256 RepID=A0A371BBI2_9BRAD|nr:hypothetical protein [Undibacter mobilis]RDV04934.1 hypothetical protein DXH78_10390 [Undibacter mobilis]